MALAAAPSAAPARTAPPVCIPARAEEGHVHQGSGATACTEYPKECSEGSKLTTTEGTMTECKRECAKGYYSKTGVYPCKACKRGYTTTERGAVSA